MTYIPTTSEQEKKMLTRCGAASVAELFADIPQELQTMSTLSPEEKKFWETSGLSEFEIVKKFSELAAKNFSGTLFAGGGFYDHFVPAAIDAIISRSEFYTAYTPYQPELSQGTLQAIYEYQSQICRLTGMEISNASLYDGGTAIFEACKMATGAAARKKIVVCDGVNPIYRNMLKTHTANLDVEIVEIDVAQVEKICDDKTAAIVLQNPNCFGVIEDQSSIVDKCKSRGIITIQVVNPIALAIIKTPAEQGFDIAVGEGQSLGMPLSFGGPYLGFIGAKKEFARKMPGRIVARTEDTSGKAGFVLSLQAREQHIRREKATSNICSNEALCALRAHVYLSLMGKEGLKEVATLCHSKTIYLRDKIKSEIQQIKIVDDNKDIFNEFVIDLTIDADVCINKMLAKNIFAGIPVCQFDKNIDNKNLLLIAVTEKRTREELDNFVDNLKEVVS